MPERVYPRVMSETETPPETETTAEKTLSTKVDDDLYEWFVAHARENFRNLSGQLAYVLHRYRLEQTGDDQQLAKDFGRALGDRLLRDIRVPRPGQPYVGEPDPTVRVTWNQPVSTASVIPGYDEPMIDDDPEEGVK